MQEKTPERIEFERLVAEGQEWVKGALAVCNTCEFQVERVPGLKQCSICGCFTLFKVYANKLITSKCPIGKW